MKKKQSKPLDFYIRLGAISKIAKRAVTDMYMGYQKIFTVQELAKISRANMYLDDAICLADTKLFQEHGYVGHDGTRIFYGDLSTELSTETSRNVDSEVARILIELLQKTNVPYEFMRILEILYDYWLSEPDEYHVEVNMRFMKADGQHQEKNIVWRNKEYETPELIKKRHTLVLRETHSFYDYLIASHYGEESPEGDFAYDIRRDLAFPISVHDAIYNTQNPTLTDNPYREIQSYLRTIGASVQSLTAFDAVWEEYLGHISKIYGQGKDAQ